MRQAEFPWGMCLVYGECQETRPYIQPLPPEVFPPTFLGKRAGRNGARTEHTYFMISCTALPPTNASSWLDLELFCPCPREPSPAAESWRHAPSPPPQSCFFLLLLAWPVLEIGVNAATGACRPAGQAQILSVLQFHQPLTGSTQAALGWLGCVLILTRGYSCGPRKSTDCPALCFDCALPLALTRPFPGVSRKGMRSFLWYLMPRSDLYDLMCCISRYQKDIKEILELNPWSGQDLFMMRKGAQTI